MARPESLIAGNCYFFVGYSDEELRVPLISTLRYVERINGAGEESWVFESVSSATTDGSKKTDSSAPPLVAFNESQLSHILELPDLQGVLNELAALHPITLPSTPTAAITLDDLMRNHDLKKQIKNFLASSHAGLTIRIRFTDDSIFLDKEKDGITAGFFPHPQRAPEENNRLENLFKNLGIAPYKDYLADQGRTRILGYRLDTAKVSTADLCGRVLVDVYKMKVSDKLEYSFRN